MRLSLFTLLVMGLMHTGAAAQQADVSAAGRVLGPDGTPLPGQDVVLHRVDAAGGATIAETVSDADGAFSMTAAATADTSAVFFVAARHAGELYIGPPFKPGMPGTMDQQIQVGVPGMSASAMLAQDGGTALPPTGTRPVTSRTWLLLLVPLLGVAAVALSVIIPRRRIPEDRALLIRVARLDETAATAPPAHREQLLAERARLMTQLRTH